MNLWIHHGSLLNHNCGIELSDLFIIANCFVNEHLIECDGWRYQVGDFNGFFF